MFLQMSSEEFDQASVVREVVEGRVTRRRVGYRPAGDGVMAPLST